MIGLSYGEKNCDDYVKPFHLIPERNGQMDGQTDLLYQYRASVCSRAIKTTCVKPRLLTHRALHLFRHKCNLVSDTVSIKADAWMV